jgi:hypothetical protein
VEPVRARGAKKTAPTTDADITAALEASKAHVWISEGGGPFKPAPWVEDNIDDLLGEVSHPGSSPDGPTAAVQPAAEESIDDLI